MTNDYEALNNSVDSSLTPVSITHTDFIKALFNDDDILHIRVLSDRKSKVAGNNYKTAEKLSFKAGMFEQHIEELSNFNKKNNGIFFVVNTGGDDDESITRINAQFMECDEGTFEEQLKKISSFPLEPSFIIKTRKSLHTYWLMKDAKVSMFREVQKGLVSYFKSDPNCVNESRCMRLPGFYHCKKEPILVSCILYKPENIYTQEQLIANLPDVKTDSIEVKDGDAFGLEIITNSCDFIKHCKDDSKSLSEHDWYAMITNLYPFKGGVRLIHEYSKDYPTYNTRDTDNKIKHFIDSKTKPITCKVICDKGFKCPKFLSGECDCKSPAAIAYKPISVEGLQNLLSNIPVTNNPLQDIPNINKFIKTYMFNQDKAVADTFISYAIKNRFSLKNEDVKSIKSSFSKIYSDAHSGVEDDPTIPPWYKVTRTGYKYMPMVLANYLSDNEKVIFVSQDFHRYVSGVYKKIEPEQAEAIVQSKLLVTEGKYSQIIDAKQQWRMKIYTDMKELNPNPYTINLKNGLYDVLTDTLRPHSEKYLSTIQFNVRFDKDAKCPLFHKYLNEALEGNIEQINLIQEMLGYLLVPITSAQRSFVLHGSGNTGKSVLLHVINVILLGKDNVSNVTWQDLGEKFRTSQLYGKLANIFADLPQKNIDDTGIFKALVGEDLVLCEEKFKRPFSFKSFARLVFSCNKIPISYNDKTNGFYRRLLIIPFNRIFTEKDIDVDLKEKLEAEGDGILIFALLGLKRLIKNRFRFSETKVNIDELEKYKTESDSVLSFFSECCELEPDCSIPSTTVYANYCTYCQNNGFKSVKQKSMVATLTGNYPDIKSSSNGANRTLKGLRIIYS